MGPRLFSRGDPEHRLCATRQRASMGPRLFSRGDETPRPHRERRGPASMGPRLFSRGDDAVHGGTADRGRGFNGATAFQPWRLCQPVRIVTRSGQLQWGHGFSAVETLTGCCAARLGNARFNGATAFQPWRPAAGVQLGHHRSASMGPRLFSRGDGGRSCRAGRRSPASMGPRLFSRGDKNHLLGSLK